jgi:aspartate kinase
VATLSLRAPRMLGAHGFLRTMFEIFDRYGAAVDVVTTSEVSVSLSLEQGPPPALLAELERLGQVTLYTGRAIICVVGEGLRETPGVAARIFRAVGPANIEMISQGASKINVTFILDDRDAPDAVRRLHAEFFGA